MQITLSCSLIMLFLITIPAISDVKKENGKVYIEGVERLQWDKGQNNTFIGAYTAVLHNLGENVSYDYMMGVSGAAFKVQSWLHGWCPSAGDAGCGFNSCTEAANASGYKCEWTNWYESQPEQDKIKGMKDAVITSIDKGKPLIFLDGDYGIVAGYTDDGNKLLYRSYFDKSDEYTTPGKWPWIIMSVGEKTNTTDKTAIIRRSLENAVKIMNSRRIDSYASGITAYNKWIADLNNDDAIAILDDKALGETAHANMFIYCMLVDARKSAAKYIASIIEESSPEAKPHLTSAADLYQKLAITLEEGGKQYVSSGDGSKWTPEMRHAQAATLKKAMKMDMQAVQEIEKALAAMN